VEFLILSIYVYANIAATYDGKPMLPVRP